MRRRSSIRQSDIYKAISRYLRRHVLRSARHELRRICQAHFYEVAPEIHKVDAEPSCYAYVNWRMAWELIDRPARLYGERSNGTNTWRWSESVLARYQETHRLRLPEGTDVDVARRINERIFGAACVAVFKQFRNHYEQVGEGGHSAWIYLRASPLAAPFFILEPIGTIGLKLRGFVTSETPPILAYPSELL